MRSLSQVFIESASLTIIDRCSSIRMLIIMQIIPPAMQFLSINFSVDSFVSTTNSFFFFFSFDVLLLYYQ